MKLELEDLTKEELIRLFRRHVFRGPTQWDMLWERWETIVAKARCLGEEGQKARQARDWKRAEKLWAEEQRAWKRAEAVLAEAEKICLKL
ncbi:hypothetical protein [Humidesulfovibrio idahonensis]